MANPQMHTYTALGARTVRRKAQLPDVVTRVSIEETPIWALMPHQGVQDPHVELVEDNLQVIDTANAHAEGAPAPAAASTARSVNENWCQDFRKTVEVSDLQQTVAQWGVRNEYDYQLGLRTLEFMRDIEACMISDQAGQAGTPANGRVYTMKGMATLITTNTNLVANWNKANLDTEIQSVYGTSGGDPSVMWMDLTRKVTAAAFAEEVTRYQPGEHMKMYNEVQVYNSPVGRTLTISPHRYLPQNFVGTSAVVYGLDMTRAGWKIYEAQPMRVRDLPWLGGARSAQISWQGCIMCGAEKANFEFAG